MHTSFLATFFNFERWHQFFYVIFQIRLKYADVGDETPLKKSCSKKEVTVPYPSTKFGEVKCCGAPYLVHQSLKSTKTVFGSKFFASIHPFHYARHSRTFELFNSVFCEWSFRFGSILAGLGSKQSMWKMMTRENVLQQGNTHFCLHLPKT